MARLLRPVTKIISVIPAAAASSTAYWISGLSTIGSISLGLALVTGRKRLPRPATGNTAFLSLACMGSQILQQFEEFLFSQYPHAEPARALELGSGILAGDDEIGFLGHRSRHFVPFRLDRRTRLVARHAREAPGEHEAFDRACLRSRRGGGGGPAYPVADQILDHLPVMRLVEELPDRARHHRSHVRDLEELFLGGACQRL